MIKHTFLSLPPITGAIVGLDQSSYEVNEGDNNFTVCVILYDGVLTTDSHDEVQLNVRRRRGSGTAGIQCGYVNYMLVQASLIPKQGRW